jgi:hypothetical protein
MLHLALSFPARFPFLFSEKQTMMTFGFAIRPLSLSRSVAVRWAAWMKRVLGL